jgi:hypothetical protein
LADWLDELETELNIKKEAPLIHIKLRGDIDENSLAILAVLLAFHKGSVPVVLHCGNQKRICREIKVKPTTRLLDEVSYLLGKDSIAFAPLDYEFGKEGNN